MLILLEKLEIIMVELDLFCVSMCAYFVPMVGMFVSEHVANDGAGSYDHRPATQPTLD